MNHRPHQWYCVRCVNRGKGCDLVFEDMKVVNRPNTYSHMVTLVICTEFKQRER